MQLVKVMVRGLELDLDLELDLELVLDLGLDLVRGLEPVSVFQLCTSFSLA